MSIHALGIKVDTSEVTEATKALNDLAAAAERAKVVLDRLQGKVNIGVDHSMIVTDLHPSRLKPGSI